MTCDEFRPFLHEYVLGDLGAPARQILDRHANECAACLAEADALQKVDRALASQPVQPVPPGLTDRLMARLPAPGRSFRREARRLAAAALLVIGLGAAASVGAVRDSAEEAISKVPMTPGELFRAAGDVRYVLPFKVGD